MAVDLNSFKAFMGWSTPGESGSYSVGVLTATKADSSDQGVYTFQKGSVWQPVDKPFAFINPEGPWTISESAQSVSFAVRSRLKSPDTNIPANTPWPPQQGIVFSNSSAFTGGAEPTEGQKGLYPDGTPGADGRIQQTLNIGTQVVRNILCLRGGEPLEDDPLINECIYLFASFRLSQTRFQMEVFPVQSANPTSAETRLFFRDQLYRPLLLQIENLLASKINWKRKINGDKDDS